METCLSLRFPPSYLYPLGSTFDHACRAQIRKRLRVRVRETLLPRVSLRDRKKRKDNSFNPRHLNRWPAKSHQNFQDFRRVRFDYRWSMPKESKSSLSLLLFNIYAGNVHASTDRGVRVRHTKQWLTCDEAHHVVHRVDHDIFASYTGSVYNLFF